MSRPQTDQSVGEGRDFEDEIASYLLQHPAFFQRNPQILETLQIPHPTGDAISLIEYQVRVLRKQLETERNRLTHLISRAREYEALSAQLHALTLQIIAVDDADHLCALLKDAMLREFHAQAVALKLFPIGGQSDDLGDPSIAAFRDFLDRRHALCGPLNEDKARVLFGDRGAGVRAAALVPVRTEQRSGILAIGSTDPERFHPSMGTDFLDQLGDVVSHKLRTLASDGDAPCASVLGDR